MSLASLSVLVVTGPTGVGKTALAVDLCRRFDGEIVGADSVQVYRYFDIGSGKPTPADLCGVAHHMLDVFDPNDAVDAAHFAERAQGAIAECAARGRLPVVVGGTGLWLRALLRGLLELPAVDEALRARLTSRWDADGGQTSFSELRRVDPLSAATIHPNDRLRVVRALEVYRQTGRPLGALRREHALGAPRYRTFGMLLDVPRETYRTTIEQRVHGMMARGFVEEVQALRARYGDHIRPMGSVGYRQVLAHLTEHSSLEATHGHVVQATLLYGRRQRTWFSSDPVVDLQTTPAAAREAQTLQRIERFLCAAPGA